MDTMMIKGDMTMVKNNNNKKNKYNTIRIGSICEDTRCQFNRFFDGRYICRFHYMAREKLCPHKGWK